MPTFHAVVKCVNKTPIAQPIVTNRARRDGRYVIQRSRPYSRCNRVLGPSMPCRYCSHARSVHAEARDSPKACANHDLAQRAVGLAVLDHADDEAHRLRQLGGALGAIADAALRNRAAQPVAVGLARAACGHNADTRDRGRA